MTNINTNTTSIYSLLGGLVILLLSIFLWRGHPVGLTLSGVLLMQSLNGYTEPDNESAKKPEYLFQNLSSGIILLDTNDVVENMNQTAEKILQKNKHEMNGKHISDVFPNAGDHFWEVNDRVYEIKNTPLIDHHNHLQGMVVMLYDITEHKLKERELSHMATHDNLTDLPNRELFIELVSHAVEKSKRNGSRLAVLFLDIDNFKSINDTYGHESGDRVLEGFAKRLKYVIRAEDTAARLAGDEFAILLENISSPLAIATVIEKIFLALSIPINMGEEQISVTTSIGVSICPKDGDEPKNLIMKADMAMYHVKKGGKNTFQFYYELPKD